jgi:hypothetical protein
MEVANLIISESCQLYIFNVDQPNCSESYKLLVPTLNINFFSKPEGAIGADLEYKTGDCQHEPGQSPEPGILQNRPDRTACALKLIYVYTAE